MNDSYRYSCFELFSAYTLSFELIKFELVFPVRDAHVCFYFRHIFYIHVAARFILLPFSAFLYREHNNLRPVTMISLIPIFLHFIVFFCISVLHFSSCFFFF